ncbi:hypothetical protein D3C87_1699400 [compost metagenome]
MQSLAVARKIELLLALLGDADIGDDRIVFARCQAERPVDPGDRHEFQRQAETVGDRKRIVRIRADHGFCVGRVGRKRWSAGADGDGEFAWRDELETRRYRRNCRIVAFGADAPRLFRAEVEAVGGRNWAEMKERCRKSGENCWA